MNYIAQFQSHTLRIFKFSSDETYKKMVRKKNMEEAFIMEHSRKQTNEVSNVSRHCMHTHNSRY